MTTTSHPIYVFDLDGVITDPEGNRVDDRVIDAMYQLLASGTRLAVNTGRSLDWVERNLVSALLSRGNPAVFENFITVCEKGGATVRWQHNEAVVDASEYALSTDVYAFVKTYFEQSQEKYPTMFWDDTKRTMATMEKYVSADMEQFQSEQAALVQELRSSIASEDVRVDPTTIATDVETVSAGKYAGAQLIHRWIRNFGSGDDPAYVCFGDSASDYEMARYFIEQGAQTIFVFVGDKLGGVEQNPAIELIQTNAHYAEGTLEYLNSQLT